MEECPICFLSYPLLNTSRCCGKRVCTECFLQARVRPAGWLARVPATVCGRRCGGGAQGPLPQRGG